MPWKKGQSGNPKGRPPKGAEQRKFEALCRENATDALQVLIDIMSDREKSDRDRIRASEVVLGYAYGKPKQMQVISAETGQDSGMVFTATVDPRAQKEEPQELDVN